MKNLKTRPEDNPISTNLKQKLKEIIEKETETAPRKKRARKKVGTTTNLSECLSKKRTIFRCICRIIAC